MDPITPPPQVVRPQLSQRSSSQQPLVASPLPSEGNTSATLENRRICPVRLNGEQICAGLIIAMVLFAPVMSCLAAAVVRRRAEPPPSTFGSEVVCRNGLCMTTHEKTEQSPTRITIGRHYVDRQIQSRSPTQATSLKGDTPPFLAPHLKYCQPAKDFSNDRLLTPVYQTMGLWPGLMSRDGTFAIRRSKGMNETYPKLEAAYKEAQPNLTELPKAPGGYGYLWEIDQEPVVLEPGRELHSNFGNALESVNEKILTDPESFFSLGIAQIVHALQGIYGCLTGRKAPSSYRRKGLIVLPGNQRRDASSLLDALRKADQQKTRTSRRRTVHDRKEKKLRESLKTLTPTQTDPGFQFDYLLSKPVQQMWNKIGYVALPPEQIASAMKRLVRNWKTVQSEANPWALSAYIRSELAKIAPFEEYNDVFARIVMQIPLLIRGVRAVVFTDADAYWNAVQEDAKNPGAFAKFLCKPVRRKHEAMIATSIRRHMQAQAEQNKRHKSSAARAKSFSKKRKNQ